VTGYSELIDVAKYLRNFTLIEQDGLFAQAGQKTVTDTVSIDGRDVPRFINEYWTARQRQSAPLHEISYRACFKGQLPRFFIDLLTKPGDTVYDPFSGRGTTVVEAALAGRRVIANDINPLSRILARPRLFIPSSNQVRSRLAAIPFAHGLKAELDLSMFYHPDTEAEVVSLRNYLLERRASGGEDDVDEWIRMVATNRLTGHSPGFFSVYTLPPNQATSPERQLKINQQRNQTPPYRHVSAIIQRKSDQLVRGLPPGTRESLTAIGDTALFLTGDARTTPAIADGQVALTVTSPPFLNIVQYAADNWLRCWFNGIDAEVVARTITMSTTVNAWSKVMRAVFLELARVTAPGGWVAFEVGEVGKSKVKLDEHVVPMGTSAGFVCHGIVINLQEFTKTSNIWGVVNNARGTNTNRIVLFQKQ